MLLAVKHDKTIDREGILAKIEKMKDFYGIHEHCLETLLSTCGQRCEEPDRCDGYVFHVVPFLLGLLTACEFDGVLFTSFHFLPNLLLHRLDLIGLTLFL